MKRISLIIMTFTLTGLTLSQGEEITNALVYKGHSYELIKEQLTWEQAVRKARKSGGYLVEISSEDENSRVLSLLKQLDPNEIEKLKVLDGAGASYAWIGAEDLGAEREGVFSWNGSGLSSGDNIFWKGGMKGDAVEEVYTNWGLNNPGSGGLDERGSNVQDAVGIAINHWPQNAPPSWTMGQAGQWNDISEENELYYIVEYNYILPKLEATAFRQGAKVYPVPFQNEITVVEGDRQLQKIEILSLAGQLLNKINSNGEAEQVIFTEELKSGLYVIRLLFSNGESYTEKILKK